MRYLSVCSGIEAASVAWHPLGWEPVGFSEIEPFPSAVLAHRYPDVPNHGDMTQYRSWPYEVGAIDLLVGGTPCQSFSVAGLRKGLDDPRGNLALVFLGIADKFRPRWVVWENVPGVLSSNGGRDFGSFLGALGELGYGWAYRVLDAQYVRTHSHPHAVPQRRRRVFVVGCLGDPASARAVLFERESLRRNPPPRREAGQRVAPAVSTGAPFSRTGNERVEAEAMVAHETGQGWWKQADHSGALRAEGENRPSRPSHVVAEVAHTLTRKHEGLDDGTGRGTPIVPWPAPVAPTLNAHFGEKQGLEDQHALGGVGLFVPFDTTQMTSAANRSNPKPGDPCHPLAAGAHPPAVAFSVKDYGADAVEGLSPTLRAGGHNTSHANGGVMPAVAYGIDEEQNGTQEFFGTLKARTQGGGFEGAVAFNPTQSAKARSMGESVEVAPTMGAQLHAAVAQVQWSSGGGKVENDTAQTLRSGAEHNYQFARIGMAVRRLTPTECERLQGFLDGWTNVPWRKKDEAPDGPRYKALGNSMAVNVMRWIGDRIAEVDEFRAKGETK